MSRAQPATADYDRPLHVAALAFPTAQGTQAAIAAMLAALRRRGEAPQLLTYAHGDGTAEPGVAHQRLPDWPRERSLRSGPTLRKVALDVSLALHLARRTPRSQPVIAHHVEAAAAARLSRRRHVFVAHTELAHELQHYGPVSAQAVLRTLGGTIDRHAAQDALRVVAIAPALARSLGTKLKRPVGYLPVPWQPAAASMDREVARAELGIADARHVVLYAGNLDRYQGWEHVVEALAASRDRTVTLLLATESRSEPLWDHARCLGVADQILACRLREEADRIRVHAAADVIVVPRRAPGGLPIKLLDALARSRPIVAMRRACADLDVNDAIEIVDDDSGAAIAAAVARLRNDAALRACRVTAGSAYLVEQHGDAKFLAAYDAMFPL